MGKKIMQVLVILGAVLIVYILLTAMMPVLTDAAGTSNATITASSNFTDYPGSQATLLGAPFWLYFAPAGIGIVLIVYVLKG